MRQTVSSNNFSTEPRYALCPLGPVKTILHICLPQKYTMRDRHYNLNLHRPLASGPNKNKEFNSLVLLLPFEG